MSVDKSRVNELQGALRQKMADNKAIADSFKVEDGTVVVNAEQKSAFDRNMADIKEIKSLIEGLESFEKVEAWGSEQASDSVAAQVAAAAAGQPAFGYSQKELRTIGEQFLESAEFKALNGGRNGANMPAPFEVKASFTAGYSVKDVYSALPTGFPTQFGTVQRHSAARLGRELGFTDGQAPEGNAFDAHRVGGVHVDQGFDLQSTRLLARAAHLDPRALAHMDLGCERIGDRRLHGTGASDG